MSGFTLVLSRIKKGFGTNLVGSKRTRVSVGHMLAHTWSARDAGVMTTPAPGNRQVRATQRNAGRGGAGRGGAARG